MANLLSSTIGSHFYGSYNESNILLKTAGNNGDGGILLQNSVGAFRFQIYGNGTDYGFLNGSWAGWDIRKTIGGVMYMNNNNSYYLQTDSTSNFLALNIQGNAVIHAGNIGSQSVSYASSAGNADTLDGYHASSLTYVPIWTINTQSAERSGFVSGGSWYRVANLGTERFFARVRIYDNSSGGPHSSVEFQVAGAFNLSSGYSFNLTSNGYYSAPSVTQVRILSAGTYDPQYLEVYISYVGYSGSAFAVSLLEARNATVVNWDNGSIPSGYSATTWDANAPLAVGGRAAIFNSGVYNTNDYSRFGNVLVGQGTYKNIIKPIGDANLNIHTPSGAVYFDTYGQASGSFRAPIFYDSDDTGYYLDPNGTSNLNKFSERTMAFNDMNPKSINSPYVDRYNGSVGYRNGTMGYANTDFNTIARNWGSGFIDTWSTPANAPGGSTHYIGLQGVHYSDGGTSFYGFQMACAGEADNRFFWRSSWPSMRSWVEMIHSGNIASQSVSYADESGYSASSGSVEWTSVNSRPTALSQFTNDLGNYGGWLTTGGKAADSELIDGVDSSRIVYGDGPRASTSSGNVNDPNQKSGFFFDYQPTGAPFGGEWWNWMTVAGNSWQSSNNYSFQLAHQFHGEGFYVRRMTNGEAYSWREVITSGNIASQSVSYADESGFASSAGSVEWTSVQNKPATFPPSSHTHDDRYYTESESDGRYVPYGSITGSFGLNDNKLYLRTNGDNNHYLWNAADDWEELNAYEGTGFRITSNSGTVGVLYVYGASNGGYTYSPYSFRAPIFYDSEDTGYYVDPNGTSRIERLNISAGQVNAANNAGGRLRISSYTNGESVINGNTHNIVLGPYSTRTGPSLYYAGIAITGLMNYSGVTSYDVAPHIWLGGYYRDTPGSERSDFVVAIKSGTGLSGAGSDLPEPRFRVDYEGIASATGSFRAPIFYDSNDTQYYCDPNNYSSFYGVAIRGDVDSRGGGNQIFFWSSGNTTTSAIGFKAVGGVWNEHGYTSAGYNTYFTMDTANRGLVFRRATVGGSDWTGANVASISNTGNAQFDGYVNTPAGYVSNGNPWNTANSAFFPNGITTAGGTNWIYGFTYIGNAPGNGAGHEFTTSGTQYSTGSITTPLFLVNNHSDNTRGYRIHNTSGSSVSAMFTNSSNALVIGAGAFDQVNLNKKVYVNGVALGVNVAPSATAGRIDASNDIVAYSSSDERLKQNITPIANALDKVKSLTGVEFDWKPEYKGAHGYEGHDTGIIAQQVQAVMPSAVRTNETGFLAVRYEKLIGLLVEANKELAARVEELEKKLG